MRPSPRPRPGRGRSARAKPSSGREVSSTAPRPSPRTGPPDCPRRGAAGSARLPSGCPPAPGRRSRSLPPALLTGPRPAAGETASSLSPSGLAPAADDRLVGPALALVVDPGDRDLLARLAAFEAEVHERVLRYRGPPLRRKHRLAGVGHGNVLDEMRGNERAARVLALACLHLVCHQHADLDLVARHAGADTHRIGHVSPRTRREGPQAPARRGKTCPRP